MHIRWTWRMIVAAAATGLAVLGALADGANNWQTVTALVPFATKTAVAQDIETAITPIAEAQTRLENKINRQAVSDLQFQITVLQGQKIDLQSKVDAGNVDLRGTVQSLDDQIADLKRAKDRAQCEDDNRFRGKPLRCW